MTRLVRDVACTRCGCVCDDLRLTVEGERITRAEGACHLAEPWFLGQGTRPRPSAEIDGQPASVEDAIARAATLLKTARTPLIYGLARSATEGQRAAVALADRLGACIDTPTSLGGAPSLLAFQQVGQSTCSLGEVKNRADLIVYWNAGPAETHPRLIERCAGKAPDRPERTVILIDEDPRAETVAADLVIPLVKTRNYEALSSLRLLVADGTPAPDADLGVDRAALTDLARRLKTCRFGIVFFGAELGGHRTVEALFRLVADLNAHTRFYARHLGHLPGADLVLAWQTGYPTSVSFARGYPRYGPGEFSAVELLERGEVDCCLLVGSETVPSFSAAALARLRTLPTIALDLPETESPTPTTVRFTVDTYGIHRPGTVYRLDEVPIPLRVVLPTVYPSDEEILTLLQKAIGSERL